MSTTRKSAQKKRTAKTTSIKQDLPPSPKRSVKLGEFTLVDQDMHNYLLQGDRQAFEDLVAGLGGKWNARLEGWLIEKSILKRKSNYTLIQTAKAPVPEPEEHINPMDDEPPEMEDKVKGDDDDYSEDSESVSESEESDKESEDSTRDVGIADMDKSNKIAELEQRIITLEEYTKNVINKINAMLRILQEHHNIINKKA